MTIKPIVRQLILIGAVSGFASNAYASGFQLFEQNGAGVGDYHAGGAAEAADASTGFYNPAGLTKIENQQLVFGGAIIQTSMKFTGSVDSTLGVPKTGEAKGGVIRFVPNFHYSKPINDKWTYGFGVTTPFGLATDYSIDSVAADAATKTEMRTINLGPRIAYRFNDHFSVGGGPDFQHMNVVFNNIALENAALGQVPDNNEGSGWAPGFTAGALYEFNQDTRVGLTYHSQVVYHLTGTGYVNVSGVVTEQDIKANVTLPPYATLSGYHQINSDWSVMGSATYTKWSTIPTLTLSNVPLTTAPVVVHTNYKNTWNFSVGTHYNLSEKAMLKLGVGYDFTPTTKEDRDIRLPDENRFTTAIGGHYQWAKNIGLDLGWTHFFVKQSRIDKTQDMSSLFPVTTTTNGHVDGSANVVGLQLTWDIV